MSLKSIFRRARPIAAANEVYAAIMAQAREPVFFTELGVPDTVDGRFETVALHAFLVLRRIKGDPAGAAFGQELFDVMFEDMDISLREMGAGDMGVGKRVKAMVQAFYGRISSYDAGLSGSGDGLEEALRRNLYGTTDVEDEKVAEMEDYVRRQAAHLEDIPAKRILAADFRFGAVK